MPFAVLAAGEGAVVAARGAWLGAVAAVVAGSGMREDCAENTVAIAQALAEAAKGSTSAPLWPELVEATGLSRSTVTRRLAWLRRAHLLVTVEHGSTQRFRPASMVEVAGNRAAVYLLTTPAPPPPCRSGRPFVPAPTAPRPARSVPACRSDRDPETMIKISDTPCSPLPWERREIPPHAREDAGAPHWPGPSGGPRSAVVATKAKDDRGGGGDQVRSEVQGARGRCEGPGPRARRRAEQLAAAAALRERSLDLRPISPAAIASITRPLLAAGWEVADLVHAIEHTPDGARRWFTSGPAVSAGAGFDVDSPRPRGRGERAGAPVRSAGGWLTSRLAPWQGRSGPVAALRAAQVAAGAARAAAAASRRAEAAAAAASAVAPPAGFAAARAALRQRAGGRPGPTRRPWTPAP